MGILLFSSCLFFPKTCMFVMSKVSLKVYSCYHHYSIALACTETGIKNKFKKNQAGEVLQKNPCSGSNADAEIKAPLLKTQSCERFLFKAGSRSQYSHACFTCCLEFLACPNFYLTGSFTYTFVLCCLHFKLHQLWLIQFPLLTHGTKDVMLLIIITN